MTVLFDLFTHHFASSFPHIDVVVGLGQSSRTAALILSTSSLLPTDTLPAVAPRTDARGFLIGPAICPRLNAAFVPLRKPGKLPGPVASTAYEKEYGADGIQMQKGAIRAGQKVVIVDDLLATGGTLRGAVELVKAAGGEVLQCVVLIELAGLKGRQKIAADVHAFIQYSDD